MLNKIGPSMEPCGTPVFIFLEDDLEPFIVTKVYLLAR